jgi:hypothetical protein
MSGQFVNYEMDDKLVRKEDGRSNGGLMDAAHTQKWTKTRNEEFNK